MKNLFEERIALLKLVCQIKDIICNSKKNSILTDLYSNTIQDLISLEKRFDSKDSTYVEIRRFFVGKIPLFLYFLEVEKKEYPNTYQYYDIESLILKLKYVYEEITIGA